MKYSSIHFAFSTLSLLTLITLTGCGDIIQDLKINTDGSGTLETSFDLGDLMSMSKGFNGLGTDSTGFTDDTMPELSPAKTDTLKDPMQQLIEKITDPSYSRDIDTLISFISIMPDSVKAKETRLDLAGKISIRLVSPANSANLTIGMVAAFDNAQQLREILHYMESLDEKPEIMATAGPTGLQTKSFLLFDIDLKTGWIKIDSMRYGDVAAEFGMSQDSAASSEALGMMELMFGNSKIKSIIHVPGEVLSCTNPDAILTKDNKVMLEYDFLEVINKGSTPGYTIQFRPGKS